MSVFKRPLLEGEVLEDNRYFSLNTNVPDLYPTVSKAEVVAPKAAKKEKEKEVVVETAVEEEVIVDEKPLDMVVG